MNEDTNNSFNDDENISSAEDINAEPIEAEDIVFAEEDGHSEDNGGKTPSEVSDTADNENEVSDDAEKSSDYDNENSEYEIKYEDDFMPSYASGKTNDNTEDDVSYGRRNRNRSKRSDKSKKNKRAFIKILITAAIVIIAAVLVWSASTLPKDTIMKNVYIEDTDVSGKTYDEALAIIKKDILLENQEVTLSCRGRSFSINGSEIGIIPNPENTVKLAFNYGKTGNILTDSLRHIKTVFIRKSFIPVAAIDSGLLDQKINEFGIEIYGEMAEHYVEKNDETSTATIWPGHTGYNPNSESSYKAAETFIIEQLKNSRYYNIPVDLRESRPKDLTLEAFDAQVYAEPVNAHYTVKDNQVEIAREMNGRYINKDEAAVLLPAVKEGGDIVKIPYYLSYPEITAEQLKAKLFNATLASYSTNYGGSTSNRKANIANAASKINGKVLAPGDTFSFNDTVGDRTASNGFFTATEYVEGKEVEGIGGGTCQVSTTLYSAVLYADLQIVSRSNHALTVGYVPLGQDATVAYGSVDFKFKNSSDAPVKITATANGSSLNISIIGSQWQPERRVELKHNTRMNGEETVVTSTRYVYEGDNLISTDSLGTSYYQPHKPKEEENDD